MKKPAKKAIKMLVSKKLKQHFKKDIARDSEDIKEDSGILKSFGKMKKRAMSK